MILQALTDYYELLAGQGRIARPGWAGVKISWALEIDDNGNMIDVLPLRHLSEDGKKLLPRVMELPAPVKRTVGIAPNFLWDNSTYVLGIDNKGRPDRADMCFAAAREKHLSLLKSVDTSCAKAVVRFFENWQPKEAENNPVFKRHQEELAAGDNLTLFYKGNSVADDPGIRNVWTEAYEAETAGTPMRCLITGKESTPELVHPAIKNVRDAQSSGAALVSFNAPAFCSFGREQNANAPISKYAAFAYTSALNYLLADRDHVKTIGNTTIVYWAKDGEEQYRDAFAALLEGSNDQVTDEDLNSLMEAVSSGRPYNFDGLPVSPENEFIILGISPNAARLSVRFFWHSNFGSVISNLKQHYADIDIIALRI